MDKGLYRLQWPEGLTLSNAFRAGSNNSSHHAPLEGEICYCCITPDKIRQLTANADHK